MKKSSYFFRKLNRVASGCCAFSCGSFNCHALRISRALCEANQALPKKRDCRQARARRHGRNAP